MRALTIATIVMCAGIGASAAAAAPTKINIQGVLREAPGGPLYLHVSAGDLDGDGLADEAFLRLDCDKGVLKQASYSVKSPRDAASGLATGKRTHKPVTLIKEWGPATPQLRAMTPTYDVKQLKGNEKRTADGGGWTALSLSNADGLCAAAEAAGATIVKSKSNITNN